MQVVAHSVNYKTVSVASGAVRSGKTTGQFLGFALWAAQHGVGFTHAIISKNTESAQYNVGNDLINAFLDMNIEARYDKRVGTRIIFKHGGRENSIRILGAMDKRSRERIQGSTLKGLIID